MYVDRKLAGLQAVQTLSRLNRTFPGKEKTFVLDFQNTIEDMQKAFRPFFEVTALEANSDPNQISNLKHACVPLEFSIKARSTDLQKFSTRERSIRMIAPG